MSFRTPLLFTAMLAIGLSVGALPTVVAQQGGAQAIPQAPVPAQGQRGGGGGQPPCQAGETVAQHYKSIKVMSELPCTELQLAMQSIAASLGVGCDHCHVTGPAGGFDREDKETKEMARAMMRMVQEINAGSFEGRALVTCATCHHGNSQPQRTTPVALEMTAGQAAAAARTREQAGRGRGGPAGPRGDGPGANEAARGAVPPGRSGAPEAVATGQGRGAPAPAPTPAKPTETLDAVLSQYVQALGGRDALQKIQSRVMSGTVTLRDLQQFPFTVEEKLPNLYRMEIQSLPQAQVWGVSGSTVWGGRGGRGLQGFQAQQATRRADLGAALTIAQKYQDLTVDSYDVIEGRNTIVLVGRTAADTTERLHFDRETGLLIRRSVSTRTAFSPLAEQIDYSDYRDVQGVKMPFGVRYANWNEVQAGQFTDIKVNVPIDETRFAMPPQAPAGPGRGVQPR